MTAIARAGASAVLITLLATPAVHAQSGRGRFTLTGGPHAGTYELKAVMCDVKDVHGRAPSVFASFEPEKKGRRGDGAIHPSHFDFLLPRDPKIKPDQFALDFFFLGPPDGKREIAYRIYSIPAEFQEPGLETKLEGRGMITTKRTDTGATGAISGQTKDGVKIEGTFECGG